jgi:hypothetical protein
LDDRRSRVTEEYSRFQEMLETNQEC